MTEFQSNASKQGKAFEDAVATILRVKGWQVGARCVKIHDSEVDIIATDPDGVVWWIECKGSWESKANNNGSKRSDTVKKAIGVAWHLSTMPGRPPYMLVTSHLPAESTSSWAMLDNARKHGLFTKVTCVGDLAAM
ncbi:MAG: hypothetical protein ACO3S5_08315 [Ilumatobacteraceae bacterium]